MTNRTKSIARRAIPGLVALLIGLPVAARANRPETVDEAQALAQHYKGRAEQARALGAVAYKHGQLQRAEAQQAKYEAMAELMAAPPVWTAPSPVAEHYAKVAQHYRAMGGGPAYKWGRVAEAEAQQRYFESIEAPPQPASSLGIELVEPPPPSPSDHPACETVSKPVVRPLICER
jgi:hypothetical protein